MFQTGDRVLAKHGVMTEGYDLSNKIGIIKNTHSYIEVYFPDFHKTFKMLQYEVELTERMTMEDVQELFLE